MGFLVLLPGRVGGSHPPRPHPRPRPLPGGEVEVVGGSLLPLALPLPLYAWLLLPLALPRPCTTMTRGRLGVGPASESTSVPGGVSTPVSLSSLESL